MFWFYSKLPISSPVIHQAVEHPDDMEADFAPEHRGSRRPLDVVGGPRHQIEAQLAGTKESPCTTPSSLLLIGAFKGGARLQRAVVVFHSRNRLSSSPCNLHHKNRCGMKLFHCAECGRLFSRKRNLPVHVDSVHKGKKPFECEKCGKFFTQKSNLKSHLKAVHENVKPFFCSECGKSFSRKPHLVTHLDSVHMGKKPYACEICCKTFTQKSNLRSHLKAVHAVTPQNSLKNAIPASPSEVQRTAAKPLRKHKPLDNGRE
ncbi:hypothetical protein TcWFU_001331 [Taenia crassiceps]|uniref:C2H2-type domain-containing protein n=1 Tax=Taenia crassiceps TaxID=6207 RepID=A0ABR4Q2K4_9CEST